MARLGRCYMQGHQPILGIVALAFATPASASLGGYVAKLALRDCRDRAKAATKPLRRPQDRDDIVFDGIVRGRD